MYDEPLSANQAETNQTEIAQAQASERRAETTSSKRQRAKLFEVFLIGRMQQGAVDAEDAKLIAQRFVDICKSADTREAEEQAVRTLVEEPNTILHNFGLKILEMEEVQAKSNLYQYMIKLAETGKISAARILYDLFDKSITHNQQTLDRLIREQTGQLSLESEAKPIIDALIAQGSPEQAKQLVEQIEHGQITTTEQLQPWQGQVTIKIAPPEQGTKPTKKTALPTNLGQVQRVWLGIHALDKRLRILLGLDN